VALSGENQSGSREYSLVFHGLEALSESSLRQAASDELAALAETDFPEAAADDAAFMMELAYKREGYAFAAVSYGFIEEKGRDVILEFTVTEGPRVVVEAVLFAGNSAFAEEDLLAFFAEDAGGIFAPDRHLFVESKIDDSLGAVRDLYLGEGYPQVIVGEPVYVYSPDRTRVTIHCSIQEGIRRMIENVDFQGDVPDAAAPLLLDIPEELVDKPYVARRRLFLKSRIQEIYGNLGYPGAEVAVREKPGMNYSRVHLECAIASGPRVRISSVEVVGSERTGEEFIRDRLVIAPGDLYSAEKKQESFKRLYQTGLFSRVSLDLLDGPSENERILQVFLEESKAREVFFQGGWGSYELLRGSAGYQDNNLWGTGRIFRLEGGGSVKSSSLQANITDPWLLGSDITADLPLFFRRREEPSFTKEETGASLLFSRRFFTAFDVTLGYLYRESKITEISATSIAEIPESDYTTASAKLQATTDSRNDIFFPTSGHKAFAAVEIADPTLGSGISFYRANLGVRRFLPLSEKNTLGLRYDTGVILPGRDQLSIPIGERFFNGGENTVRSFRESQLGPRDILGEPLGGDAFNVIAIELRRRLTERLAASFFFDYGNLSPNRTRSEEGLPPLSDRSEVIDATLTDYFKGFRPGLGCGLLYLLPIGPARLDFSWNPDRDRERGEEGYVLHFSLGTAF